MFQSEPGFKTLRTSRASAINLLKRRAWYADEPVEEIPAPETPPAKSGETAGKTFTQEQLDKLLGERAARAREAAIADLVKELGFDSADTLKAKAKAAAEAEAAQQTELEKAQKRIADLEKKTADAESAAAKAQQERMEERRNAAILNALTSASAEKPQSVLNLLLVEHTADVQAVMSDDGTLDAKKIDALATTAKKDYAGMFRSGGPGSLSNAQGKVPASDKLKEDIRKQIRVRY